MARQHTPIVRPTLLPLFLLVLILAVSASWTHSTSAHATSAASSQHHLPQSKKAAGTPGAILGQAVLSVRRALDNYWSFYGRRFVLNRWSLYDSRFLAGQGRTSGRRSLYDKQYDKQSLCNRRPMSDRRSLSEEPGSSRELGWRPQDGRYFLATCLTGGLSDQVCLCTVCHCVCRCMCHCTCHCMCHCI